MKKQMTPSKMKYSDWARILNSSEIDIANFVDYYFADMHDYDNEIYKENASRVAHWIGFAKDDWFSRRINLFLHEAKHAAACVDLGFSIPYAYEHPSEFPNTQFLFVDKEESSRVVYDALVKHFSLQARAAMDSVVIADIEKNSHHSRVVEGFNKIEMNRDGKLLIVASEVIEHLKNQKACISLIRSLIDNWKGKHEIFITLPIGEKIPSHEYAFRNEDEAYDFTSSWLNPSSRAVLKPGNPIHGSPLESCVCIKGQLID